MNDWTHIFVFHLGVFRTLTFAALRPYDFRKKEKEVDLSDKYLRMFSAINSRVVFKNQKEGFMTATL